MENLIKRIEELKREKGVVILAHYYCRPEVQKVADFLGDSLALSVKARDIEAKTILFAGVHFMGETAKVLSPEKKVLIPNPEATCSLAESCKAEKLAEMKVKHPNALVVAYVNTTVGVKALTDICCTSSNALDIIGALPKDQKILFVPDRNLGSYINRCMERDMKLWNGCCLVHEEFSVEKIAALKALHPKAVVLVHPECKPEVVAMADYAGSTAGILAYCGREDVEEVIVVTESGILYEMESRYPNKKFYLVEPEKSSEKCVSFTIAKIYDMVSFL